VFSCEVEGFSLEDEGLENGARVDFKHNLYMLFRGLSLEEGGSEWS
jgi:hypothetical protein